MSKKSLPSQLNICLVASKFPILGRASDHGFLWPIAKGLAKLGHKVTVIAGKSPLGKAEVIRDGVRTFFLYEGFPNYSALKFEDAVFEKFVQLHAEEPFDIVHSIDASAYKIAKNKKHFHVAVAYDVDATQMSQIFSILAMSQETISSLLVTGFALAYKYLSTYLGFDRKLLATANGIFVTSPQQRLMLERYYLYPDYHIYSVPYGIELSDLSERPEVEPLRQKLQLPESAKVVVTISDMTQITEVANLVEAFERVAVKISNAYLIIVGNGPKWKEIEFTILNRALGRRVLMVGAVKTQELVDYIAVADVFVNMSSRTTGFEPSILEAMAQKKVIIGSEVSAVANIVEDGQDGFLLRPADIQSLSYLLIDIFSGQISVMEVGEKARAKVIHLFDTTQMVQAVVSAYYKVLLSSGFYKQKPPKKTLQLPISP